jgi:hypothetical protein
VLWSRTSCLSEGTCSSQRSIVFGTYHGASVIIVRTLDWNRSRISMFEFDAVPHCCTPYVHTGLGSTYTQAVCFLGTVEIFAQGSNTVSYTALTDLFL